MRVRVTRGDLLRSGAEAVLRPVTSDLEAVSGIGRRVEVEAGEDLAAHLGSVRDLPVGGALITPGGALEAAFVIHVVISAPDEPVSPGGVHRALLNGLRRAAEWEIATLALPPVGTGAGGLDAEEVAGIVRSVLDEHGRTAAHPAEIVLVVESEYDEAAFRDRVAPAPGEQG